MRAYHWLLIVLSTSLGACSSDDHPPTLGAQRLPECPDVAHEPCDTRATECQARLLALAACIYGVNEVPNVPIRVVTEEQLLEELQTPAASEEPDPSETEDERSLPHVDRTLSDLRLLQPGDLSQGGSLEALVNRADGVYQDAERGIALVDRGMAKRSPEADAVLVHEFIHAIQDARFDLASWRKQYSSDVDTQLALRSVTEGPATYAQLRALYAMSGYDLRRLDLTGRLETLRATLLADALADASPYFASLATFPYAVGVGVAARTWSDTGLHLSEAQIEAPPQTTRDALAESLRLNLPALSPIALSTPVASADYQLLDETALGAFMLELHTHKLGFSPPQARALALAWQADRLWIYEGPEQRTAWLWEVVLEDTAPLDDTHPPGRGILREQRGSRVFMAGGDEPPEFLLAAGRAFLDEGS